jgi:transposase
MADYSFEEYADMIFIYGLCNGNARHAARKYRQRYPNRRHPHFQTFSRSFRRLRETGAVCLSNGGRGIPNRHNIEDEERVIDEVQNDPTTSTRRVARQLDLSRNFVWRILKQEQLHPYHIHRVQSLHPGDAEQRVTFCEWLLHQLAHNPNFANYVLWTDEAQFSRDGINNLHNYHHWSLDNPHATKILAFKVDFHVTFGQGILMGNF